MIIDGFNGVTMKKMTLSLGLGVLICLPNITQSQPSRKSMNQIATKDAVRKSGAGINIVKMEKLIDDVVADEIKAGNFPGGVVAIVRGKDLVFEKAYGNRSLKPNVEATTLDTIYDLASVTKPVATATGIMVLVQDGKIRLNDKVSQYLPQWKEVEESEKNTSGTKHSDITIRHLLTHTSGLPSFINFLQKHPDGAPRDQIIKEIAEARLKNEVGKEMIYSDLGFITLGAIIEKVSGVDENQFTQERVFKPLGMTETTFIPGDKLKGRIAPTGLRAPKGSTTPEIIRGEVHDPNSYVLGGISGHAGLFSTASDMAKYAISILNAGDINSNKILSSATVKSMTTDHGKLNNGDKRGLGWDIESGYSSLRGDLFLTGFGHTGFTGTSIWFVPEEKLAIIILTNRVHPDDKGNSTPARAKIANIVAGSITNSYADNK